MSDATRPDYVLSFDPGGSMRTWAYALSSVRDLGDNKSSYHVIEVGFVPVVEEIAKPDFSLLSEFLLGIRERHNLWGGGYSCDLVAERYVGRGHTGSLNESIPFHLGYWAAYWQQAGLGSCRLIMASQWKLKAKKYNSQVVSTPFENWWEDYYSYLLPSWETSPTKSTERHLQDACCIGWYYWRFEKKIICLPKGLQELLS